MGQKGEVQTSDALVALTMGEAVAGGVEGAVALLEGQLDVGVVVEVVAMTGASCSGSK